MQFYHGQILHFQQAFLKLGRELSDAIMTWRDHPRSGTTKPESLELQSPLFIKLFGWQRHCLIHMSSYYGSVVTDPTSVHEDVSTRRHHEGLLLGRTIRTASIAMYAARWHEGSTASMGSVPHASWAWLRMTSPWVETVQALKGIDPGFLVLVSINSSPSSHSLWSSHFPFDPRYSYLLDVDRRAGSGHKFHQLHCSHTEFSWSLGVWTERPKTVFFRDIPLPLYE